MEKAKKQVMGVSLLPPGKRPRTKDAHEDEGTPGGRGRLGHDAKHRPSFHEGPWSLDISRKWAPKNLGACGPQGQGWKPVQSTIEFRRWQVWAFWIARRAKTE